MVCVIVCIAVSFCLSLCMSVFLCVCYFVCGVYHCVIVFSFYLYVSLCFFTCANVSLHVSSVSSFVFVCGCFIACHCFFACVIVSFCVSLWLSSEECLLLPLTLVCLACVPLDHMTRVPVTSCSCSSFQDADLFPVLQWDVMVADHQHFMEGHHRFPWTV